MIPLATAQAAILESVGELPPRPVALHDALGLVTAEDVVAPEAVPPFANTAMDGYAVRATDTADARADAPVRLTVVGELPAGRAPSTAVGRGEAIRIMTGAPMPAGADAIVMVERTQHDGDGVLVQQEARAGDHVRAVGGDLREGDLVFARRTVLGPAHLGVLASIGCVEVVAYPRARVGVVSTGDELVEGAGPLAAGQIRDSNRPMLLALVTEAGCDPIDLGVARDDEVRLEALLTDAASRCDAIVTSGGVSVGDYDVVKAVLGRIADVQLWQVAIKPAKPLAFARLGEVPVFGLAGNPVSSLVGFELFARPALLQQMGHERRFRPEIRAVAEHAMTRSVDGKLHLDRVRLRYEGGRYVAASVGMQASNMLSATAAAGGLALLADGEGVPEGGEVRVMRLDAPCDH